MVAPIGIVPIGIRSAGVGTVLPGNSAECGNWYTWPNPGRTRHHARRQPRSGVTVGTDQTVLRPAVPVWSQDDVHCGISFDRSSRHTDSAGPGTCPSGIRQHGLHADSGEQKPVAGPQLPGAGERQSCSRVSRSRGRVVPARPTPPMVAGRGPVTCGTYLPIPPVVAAPVSCSDTACTTGEVAHGRVGRGAFPRPAGPDAKPQPYAHLLLIERQCCGSFSRRSKYTMMTGSSQWVFDVCFSRRSGGPPGSSLVAPRVAWDRRGGRSGRPSATGTLSGSGRVPDTCGHRKSHHQSKHRRENASGLESPGHDAVGDRGDPFRDWPPASGMPRQNPEREHVVDLVRRRPAAKAVRPAATETPRPRNGSTSGSDNGESADIGPGCPQWQADSRHSGVTGARRTVSVLERHRADDLDLPAQMHQERPVADLCGP